MTEIRGGLQIGPLATSEDAREKSRATSRTRQVPGQRPPVTASQDGRWLCGGGGFHALSGPKVDLEGPDSSGFIWELGAELWVVVETSGAEADVPPAQFCLAGSSFGSKLSSPTGNINTVSVLAFS